MRHTFRHIFRHPLRHHDKATDETDPLPYSVVAKALERVEVWCSSVGPDVQNESDSHGAWERKAQSSKLEARGSLRL